MSRQSHELAVDNSSYIDDNALADIVHEIALAIVENAAGKENDYDSKGNQIKEITILVLEDLSMTSRTIHGHIKVGSGRHDRTETGCNEASQIGTNEFEDSKI